MKGLSLEEAKQELQANLDNGSDCPCCGQFAKRYKRKLNSSMAYVLVLLARTERGEFVHVPSYLNEQQLRSRVTAAIRGDWAKLVYWGFIDSDNETREDKSKRSGYWRITPMGRAFVAGQIRAPRHVFLYNRSQQFVQINLETVNITEALGERFDYSELMRAAA